MWCSILGCIRNVFLMLINFLNRYLTLTVKSWSARIPKNSILFLYICEISGCAESQSICWTTVTKHYSACLCEDYFIILFKGFLLFFLHISIGLIFKNSKGINTFITAQRQCFFHRFFINFFWLIFIGMIKPSLARVMKNLLLLRFVCKPYWVLVPGESYS
jgi:hypothetical protein